MYAHYDIEKATQKYIFFLIFFFLLKHFVALSTLAGPILCSVADTKTKKEKTKTRKKPRIWSIVLAKHIINIHLKFWPRCIVIFVLQVKRKYSNHRETIPKF